MLLTDDFLERYEDKPQHMNELGAFVFYRTYSRWLQAEGRRETWKEAVRRAVEYNVQISIDELTKKKIVPPIDRITIEAEILYDNIFNLRQFLSGRTHWVGGAESSVADKFPLANFSCSFINIVSWEDIGDLFYLLLVGTGVGFKCTASMADNLLPIRDDISVIHSEYRPVEKDERLEHTRIDNLGNGYVKIMVGDSKEGWVVALRTFFNIMTDNTFSDVHTIKFNYNSIRPRGERLVTFGGTASGHEPLMEMFAGFMQVVRGEIDPTIDKPERVDEKYVRVRPIHILDVGNLVGNNVVVGGVRRTAEIFLADSDDWEVILAKYGINGIWDTYKDGVITETAEEKHGKVMNALKDVLGYVPTWMYELKMRDKNTREIGHRRMSNNSVAFETKPTREMLNLLFIIMQSEGEPGFVNLEGAKKRRVNAEGLNPCAEILLDTYGVCNLTTINVDAFAIKQPDGSYELDYSGLMQAQALSTRAGVRMTCLDLELSHWDAIQKRDRLIGVSMTGWYDAMDKLNYDEQQEINLLSLLSECARIEALKYSNVLRIPIPLLDTTIKPEGTLSQVAGGVSSGLHRSHSKYYIRRIRINASDPLVRVAMELGWTVNPEVGQTWANARTLVVDFPVTSGAVKTKGDVSVQDQFDTYFRFQEHYTAHNSSNTVHVRDDEWSVAEQIVWDKWDDFIGVSFLSYDNHSYELAPYESITEEKYNELISGMKPFDPARLVRWEVDGVSELSDETCIEGACAPR